MLRLTVIAAAWLVLRPTTGARVSCGPPSAEVDGAALTFAFKGKSGVEHEVRVRDRRRHRPGPRAP